MEAGPADQCSVRLLLPPSSANRSLHPLHPSRTQPGAQGQVREAAGVRQEDLRPAREHRGGRDADAAGRGDGRHARLRPHQLRHAGGGGEGHRGDQQLELRQGARAQGTVYMGVCARVCGWVRWNCAALHTCMLLVPGWHPHTHTQGALGMSPSLSHPHPSTNDHLCL